MLLTAIREDGPSRDLAISLGGLIAIERRWLNAAEMGERNKLLARLEMMPPASEVVDFVPGWPAPSAGYSDRRAAIKSRLDALAEIALVRAFGQE